METKLIGCVYSFLHTKGFGFIAVPNGTRSPQKFFLHISKIISGAENLAVNCTVRFSVSPIMEGALPSAIDVEVLS
jgi:cold shock CspA family protein